MQRILEGIEQMNCSWAICLICAVWSRTLASNRALPVGPGYGLRRSRLSVQELRPRGLSWLEPSEGSPTVIGDRTLLRQSISNLVDNAIKYTPSGGEVNVGLDITEDTATIRVSDTGIGIAPGDQEGFSRSSIASNGVRRGTFRHGAGSGLGEVDCAATRRTGLGREHLEPGSTFYIQLPLPPEDAAETRI